MSTTKIALGYVGTDDTIRPDVDGLFRLVLIDGVPKMLASTAENDIDMSAVLTTGDITGSNVTVTGGENKALGDVTISLPQSVAPSASPTFGGLSINSGNVTFVGATVLGLNKAMVGLDNVDNTSDAGKPVSTATQTALDLKAPVNNPTFTGTVGGVTKSMVGLGNIDNTSDLNKPVSTAQQTALDAKAPVNNPTFTGTVSMPTTNINNRRVADRTAFLALIAGNNFIGQVVVDSDSNNGNKKTLYYVHNELVLWILTQQV